jgi:transitional endoplasmic reticulum ATPase
MRPFTALARRTSRALTYLVLSGVLLVGYGVTATLLWVNRDFVDDGPLSYDRAAITKPLDPGRTTAELQLQCRQAGDFDSGDKVKIVGARIEGRAYYACYDLWDGDVFSAVVIDDHGARDDAIARRAGAWRWVGLVNSPVELVLGGFGLAAVLGLYALYHSRTRRRRVTLAYRVVLTAVDLIVVFLFAFSSSGDLTSNVVIGLLVAGILFGWLGGRALLRPRPAPGDRLPEPGAPRSVAPVRRRVDRVRRPSQLPTFAEVGGMNGLKGELSDTIGRRLAFTGEADAYRIAFNGVLLHGPPGVGKTFVARATAGEFGLNLLCVPAGDLMSKDAGTSAQNVAAVFAEAARNVPCLLLLDEFDAIAGRRDDGLDEESRRVVGQVLQALEEWRPVRDLVIVAATDHLDRLDPAVVRAGRFDRHIRVDRPDRRARRAVLKAQLSGRPTGDDVDLDDLADRTAGLTPAAIVRVVEAAALRAFRAVTETGAPAAIGQFDLRAALAGRGGTDRPSIEDWSWDGVILPEPVQAELRRLQASVEDRDQARAYGVRVPNGLLLAGPPGTGKTTVARVLAAEAGFSFYPQSAADLAGLWVGEAEAAVARLFARARDNAPAIVFVDEIDAVAGTRSEAVAGTRSGAGHQDRTFIGLLTEIDGLFERHGVFVVAATDRPEIVPPVLLREGRLSRTITLPLPDRAARLRLLELFTRRMTLLDVDLEALAERTGGLSGADLEALCQQAALQSMLTAERGAPPLVAPAAFARALEELPPPTTPPRIDDEPSVGGGYL